MYDAKESYPTKIDLCDGKYTVICDMNTGRFDALRYGDAWRSLVGDKLFLSAFDEIVKLRNELSSRQWQPIETAPKDGTYILAYSPDYKHQIVFCDNSEAANNPEWETLDGVGFSDKEFACWMPLPEPPTP
jgi:hypothetical protein